MDSFTVYSDSLEINILFFSQILSIRQRKVKKAEGECYLLLKIGDNNYYEHMSRSCKNSYKMRGKNRQ